MNVFQRLFARQVANDYLLGLPSIDEAHQKRRLNAMASLNPKGFRTPPKTPRTDAQGLTRGDRKRRRRRMCNDIAREQIAAEREARERQKAALQTMFSF